MNETISIIVHFYLIWTYVSSLLEDVMSQVYSSAHGIFGWQTSSSSSSSGGKLVVVVVVVVVVLVVSILPSFLN